MHKPSVWLVLPVLIVLVTLSVAPLVIVFVWSFWTWNPSTYWIRPDLTIESYNVLFTTGRVEVLVRSFVLAMLAASLSTFIGYPIAYYIHRLARPRTALLLV